MSDCLFCKIIKGEIPSKKVFENDLVYAFEDINKVADVHVLVIPKVHIPSLNDVNQDNSKYLEAMCLASKDIAYKLNIAKSGYRLVNNCGKDGMQSVDHIHFHIIGGKKLPWPPYAK